MTICHNMTLIAVTVWHLQIVNKYTLIKNQYTIRNINDNNNVTNKNKIIINNLNSKLWQTLLTQKDL